MGKGKEAGDVRRTTDLERRAVRKSEGDRRQRLARKEWGKRWEVRQLMRRPVQPESAIRGEDGRRADTAPKKEGGDVVIGMGRDGGSGTKGKGTVTGRPARSYETRNAETVGGGTRKAENGSAGMESWEQTGEEGPSSSSEDEARSS